MIKLSEHKWRSFDGLDYYAICWEPEVAPKLVVALVHGHGDHSRSFEIWANRFCEAGIACVAFDYRGHGRSDGKRGVITSYHDLLEDVKLLVSKCEELFPGLPITLTGHSMGGNMVLSYCLSEIEPKPQLAVVLAPWLELRNEPTGLKRIVIGIVRWLFPNLTMQTGLRSKDLEQNKSQQKPVDPDPLLHNRISARLYSEVSMQCERIKESANRLKIPLLLLQGEADKIMRAEGPQYFSRKASALVTLKFWQETGHKPHLSEAQHEIVTYIIDWIKQKNESVFYRNTDS